MLGSDYRWFLLTPLIRGALLFVVVAGLCLTGLLWSAGVTATARESGEPIVATEAAAPDRRADWPRTVLRLWFLAPSLLPIRDR